MLIVWFLSIKSLPNLLFGVLCLPGDQSHPVCATVNKPSWCCICWTGLLGRAVFPPWNEGLNFGSYKESSPTHFKSIHSLALNFLYSSTLISIHGYWENHITQLVAWERRDRLSGKGLFIQSVHSRWMVAEQERFRKERHLVDHVSAPQRYR